MSFQQISKSEEFLESSERFQPVTKYPLEHYIKNILSRSAYGVFAYLGYSFSRFYQSTLLSKHGDVEAEAMTLINAIISVIEPSLVRFTTATAIELAGAIKSENFEGMGLSYQAGKYQTLLGSLLPVIFLTFGGPNFLGSSLDIDPSITKVFQKYFYTFGPSLPLIMRLYSEKQIFWVLDPKKGVMTDLSYVATDILLSLIFNEVMGYPGLGVAAGLSALPAIFTLSKIYKKPPYSTTYHLKDSFSWTSIWEETKRLLPKGASFFLQTFFNNFSSLVAKLLIARIASEPEVLVASGIVSNLSNFAKGSAEAIGYATMVLFRFALEEENTELAQKYFFAGNGFSSLIPILTLFLTQFAPEWVGDRFVDSSDPSYANLPATIRRIGLIEGITKICENFRRVSSYTGRGFSDTAVITWLNLVPTLLNLGALGGLALTNNLPSVYTILYLMLGESVVSSAIVFYRNLFLLKKEKEGDSSRSFLSSVWSKCCFWSSESKPRETERKLLTSDTTSDSFSDSRTRKKEKEGNSSESFLSSVWSTICSWKSESKPGEMEQKLIPSETGSDSPYFSNP